MLRYRFLILKTSGAEWVFELALGGKLVSSPSVLHRGTETVKHGRGLITHHSHKPLENEITNL